MTLYQFEAHVIDDGRECSAARGESASQTFRVAVTTSTIWGLVGIALIGGALLVMIGAVVWFGRR